VPLNVTLVLDTSGSMAGKRTLRAAEASAALAALLKPDDRISGITFSHTIALRVPVTNAFGTVARALAKVEAGGASAVRDAVHTAIQLVPNDQRRPLIVLLSDGEDTSSWLNSEAALDSARRANVVIDAVTFAGSTFVNQVVDATGGRRWGAGSEDHLRQLFAQALDEMRSRYLVTYSPTAPSSVGWHSVKVSLRRGRADISVRPGYFVAPRNTRATGG
jgi:Ca-activated chloride channel homolog